jgi:hypothetical protein
MQLQSVYRVTLLQYAHMRRSNATAGCGVSGVVPLELLVAICSMRICSIVNNTVSLVLIESAMLLRHFHPFSIYCYSTEQFGCDWNADRLIWRLCNYEMLMYTQIRALVILY